MPKRARCDNSCYKNGRIRQKVSRLSDADGTVRCRRSLHGPRHGPTGMWLSSVIKSAPPMGAPTTRAPDDLEPLLARGARTSVRRFCANSACTRHSHDKSYTLRHSVMITECRKLSALCMPSPVQEEFKQNLITSCGTAGDRGAAVTAHVRRARGGGVRGAGLDEYDGLARPSAAEGRGRARYVPDRGVFFRSCH